MCHHEFSHDVYEWTGTDAILPSECGTELYQANWRKQQSSYSLSKSSLQGAT